MIAGIIFIGMGLIAIIVGLAFIIPYKHVHQFAGSKVQGQIVDMVWNAALFNQPLDEAANVEHFKFAGMEMHPGTRNVGIQTDRMIVNVGSGEPDPNTVIIGRGPVNMYHKVYRYVVDGKEYMRADGVRYNKGAVEPWIGKIVPVYYNPENPQQSTLSNGKGYKLTMIILYIVGGLLILFGAGVWLLESLIYTLIW